MDIKSIVVLVAVAMLPLGLITIMLQRLHVRQGIGVRIIQMTAVVMIIPVIFILGMEGILEPATLGTLIGTLIGYILSGISDDQTGDQSQTRQTSSHPPPGG